jgi:hypothetical protein
MRAHRGSAHQQFPYRVERTGAPWRRLFVQRDLALLKDDCRGEQGRGATSLLVPTSQPKKRIRKAGRDVVSSHTPTVAPASGRHVVVAIGIDRYQRWRPLRNAVSDASGAMRILKQLGFEEVVPPLLDEQATGAAMRALVSRDLPRRLTSSDSLIVFYAGHGGVQAQTVGRHDVCTGYLIPVDGSDEPGDVTSWLEIEPWLKRISRLPARHILVIMDACNSGSALSSIQWGRGGSLPDLPFAAANKKQSRMIIASTLSDERAMDDGPMPGHSLFTGCLLEALMGGAQRVGERDGRQVTIGSEIARYVRNRVQLYPGRPGWEQTPDFGTFDYDDRGEMLIPLLLGEVDAPTLARGSTDTLGDSAGLVQADSASAPVGGRPSWAQPGRIKWAMAVCFCVLIAGVAYSQGCTAADDGAALPRFALGEPPDATSAVGNAPSGSSEAVGPSNEPTAPSLLTSFLAASRATALAAESTPTAAGRGPTEVASTSSADAAARMDCPVHVASPQGAQVSWGGITNDVPADLLLPCGVESVLIFRREHYYDRPKLVTAERKGQVVKVRMERVVISVHLTSVPPGATVTVAGRKEIKITPTDIKVPEFERSKLTLTMDGYEPITRRILPAEDGVRIDATLIKRAPRSVATP